MSRVRSLQERFTALYQHDPSGCWEWQGCTNDAGYGMFGIQRNGQTRAVRAHRVAYELFVGPIPEGKQLDHLCRNRRCVNPQHLEPVTGRVNILRGESPPAKQARQTHCKRGHPFDEKNTCHNNGHRYCRECFNAQRRAKRGVSNKDKTQCKHGHPYTEENTARNRFGHRHCRECNRTQRQAALSKGNVAWE